VDGKKVPAILLSGDHKKVDEWRLEQSIIRTRERRPDLYEKLVLENPPVPEKKKRKRRTKKTEEDNT
jgi:tRNA (guanine37-N1)-methyltransferase